MPAYRILSIDGGGIRGLYASILIQRLLRAVPRFIERCDLLAGTSTGGMIALALAHGVAIEDLIELYASRGRDVFGDERVRRAREASGMVGACDNNPLHALLDRVFGTTTLSELRQRVLIPTFHLDNRGARGQPRLWKPKFFHNFPGPDSDGAERAVDVALRTSAAPTYFPAYQGYIDGGVVANNPSMAAVAQALDRATGNRDLADIAVLSIGTGLNVMYIEAETLDWGLEQWARPLATLMIDGMMTVVDYQCTRLLGARYHRLAPVLPSPVMLDDAERIDDLNAYARAVDLDSTIAWLQQVYDLANRDRLGSSSRLRLRTFWEAASGCWNRPGKQLMNSPTTARLLNVLHTMGRSLVHRDFRLFFAGQCISQIGTWMQQMTVVWLAYRMTGDAFLVGAVGFWAQFPTFALAPLAGVWADRFDRRRLLLATQALSMVQAFTVAGLMLAGALDIWALMALVALLGAINAFDMTTSQAYVKDLVRERADLGSAIALNQAVINAARLVGPALAGVVIYYLDEGACFLVNGFSFLAVLVALAAIRSTPAPVTVAPHQRLGQSLRDGIAYAIGNRPVRDLLALIAMLALFGMPYSLLPVFARDVLHGGSNELGLLMGAGGLGALVATLRVAARRQVSGAESSLVWAGLALGGALALTGVADVLWLAMLCRLVASYCVVLQLTTASTLLQTLVDDERRGRVVSFATMAVLGALPLGNLLAGALAGALGVADTFVVSGICCLGGIVWFALRLTGFRRDVQPVYERLGLAGVEVVEPGVGEIHHH